MARGVSKLLSVIGKPAPVTRVSVAVSMTSTRLLHSSVMYARSDGPGWAMAAPYEQALTEREIVLTELLEVRITATLESWVGT